MAEKTITIRVNEDLHKQVKIHIAEQGITLKDYIEKLINADLAKGGKK